MENALYALIEADPSSRRLMIRNVPYTTTEASLKQTLEAHGPIEDFKLVIDRNTGAAHDLLLFPFPVAAAYCCLAAVFVCVFFDFE